MTAVEIAAHISTKFVARFVGEPPDLPGHKMVYCDIEPMEDALTDLIEELIKNFDVRQISARQ